MERFRFYGLGFLRDAGVITVAYTAARVSRYDLHLAISEYQPFFASLLFIIAVYALSLYRFGIHRRLWQYASIADVRALADAALVAGIVVVSADAIFGWRVFLPLSVAIVGIVFAFSGLVFVRVGRRLFQAGRKAEIKTERVVIVGAGQGGQIVAADLQARQRISQYAIGFIDDDPNLAGRQIRGLPVLGSVSQLPEIVRDHSIDVVAVAVPSASTQAVDRIIGYALESEARVQMLPSQAEVVAGRADAWRLHDINFDMLLDRIPSHEGLRGARAQEFVRGKVVLVTGAAGSIGSELCRQLICLQPTSVVALDNNETGLFHLHHEIESLPGGWLFTPVLTSITAAPKLEQVFRRFRPDVVFHAAAYKHVHMLEEHADEAVFVNVRGTQNVCRFAAQHGCESVVFVSTDKAVRPASALGFSKRIGELLIKAHQASSDTVFSCVRFGNVLGSRGSALPEFIRQLDKGGPVTVTHPDVERYFMTIPEAVSLVIQAGSIALGAEIFVLDMGRPVRIDDLVKRLIRLRGLRLDKDIEILYTGLRPGEKLSEDLSLSAGDLRATDIPRVYSARDEDASSLSHLEQQIEKLVEAATRERNEVVLANLEQVARGHDVRRRAYLVESVS